MRINYPSAAAGVLLPLTIANKWTPEVCFFGGTTVNSDTTQPGTLDALSTASTQVVRMVLSSKGIKRGWRQEKYGLPEPR